MGSLPGRPLSLLITESDWPQALKDSHTGQSPEPNGLPLFYYEMFSDTLSSHFLSAFNFIMEGQVILQDMLGANITVIP